jgi:hypothetical protein
MLKIVAHFLTNILIKITVSVPNGLLTSCMHILAILEREQMTL